MIDLKSRPGGVFGVMALFGLMLLVGQAAAADAPVDLDWGDLLPEQTAAAQAITRVGIVQHGELPAISGNQSGDPVTTKYNGKRVRIPGYVVPLDFSGAGVTEFVLVPYVGACIHVPPPPPNQIVFVTTQEPQQFQGLFAPVYVTGTLATTAMQTELAAIGYTLAADTIEPY